MKTVTAKTNSKILGSEGQLVVVIPFTLVLAIAGSLMWGYMRMQNQQQLSMRKSVQLDDLVKTMAARIAGLIQSPSPAGTCTAINPTFRAFRDFTVAAPAYDFSSATAPVTWRNTGIPCLLQGITAGGPSAEAAMLSSLEVHVGVTRPPDLTSLSSDLQITIAATTASGIVGGVDRGAIRRSNFAQRYSLRVARMGFFTLVFNSVQSASSPSISSSGGGLFGPTPGLVAVQGLTLHTANPGGTLPIDSIASIDATSQPTVFFQSPVYTLASQLTYNTALPLDAGRFRLVYRQGVSSNALPMGTGFLPISDPQGGAAGSPTWNQRINYNNMTFLPLVHIPAGVTNFAPPGIPGIDSRPGGTNNTVDTLAQAPSVVMSSAGAGGVGYNTVPRAGGPPGINDFYRLDRTCDPDTTTPKLLVFQRRTEDLTIDFVNTSAANVFDTTPNPGLPVFCGLVYVRNLTVKNCPAGQTCVLFGSFMANQIVVDGRGTVIFANPFDNATVPGAALPPQQSQMNIASQIQKLASSTAYNFFVPVFRTNPGTSFRDFRPLDARRYLKIVGPKGAIGGCPATWAPNPAPPGLTAGSIPNNSCNWIAKDVITAPNYGTGIGASATPLFPGGGAFPDNLAYMITASD